MATMTEPSRAKTPLDDSKVTMAVSFGLAGIVLGVGVILLLRIRYKEKKSDTERGALTTGVQAETDAERDQREFEEVHAKWLADPRTSQTSQLRDDSDESYRYPVRPYTFNIPGVMIPEPQQVPRQAHSRQLLSRGNTPGGPRPLSRRSARGSLARSARGFEHRFIPRPISTTISMRSFERPSTIIEESNSSMVSLPDTNVTPTKAGTPRMVLPPLPADPSQPDLVPKPLALRRGATMRESPSGNLNNMTLRRSASDATARSTTQLGHSIQATTNMQERDNSVLSSSIPEGAVEMTDMTMPPSNVDSEASERARNANRAAHVTNLAQIYAFSLPYPAVPQSRLLQTATTTNLAQSKKPARAWSTEKSSFDRNSTSGLDPSMTCHGNDTMETDPEGHFRSMEEMSAIMLEVKRCHDEESLEHDNSS